MENNFYEIPSQVPEKKMGPGLSITSLVCALVGIVFNPCYLFSLLGIGFGVAGVSTKSTGKGMGVAGLIIGAAWIVYGVICDIIASVFTGGLGLFSFFI